MAIKITDECINCGACEPECPNNAIYDAGTAWRFSDGTNLNGIIDFGGKEIDAEAAQEAGSDEVYYIVSDKCTEC
jgi:ferredoxin